MTRLAIVGLDGGTLDIIRPMVEAGELPNIARILREGVHGELESEKPPITPPAWASMMTGLNPGRHGIFHFVRRELGTYNLKLVDSRNFAGKDLLSILGRRGWTAAAFSVPMTYPPFPVNGGYMLSGIPVPLEGDSMCWPRSLKREFDAFLGHPYRPDVDFAPYEGDVEKERDDLDMYARLRDELFAVERDRLRLCREWLRRQPTDLYFCVVSVTDRIQHYFWKFQDRSHAGWTEEGERRFGGVIQDAYRLADEFVGAIREEVGEDCPIALVSDHGFGPYTMDFFVNTWLERVGLLTRRRVPYFTWGRTILADAVARLGMPWLARRLGPLARIPVVRPKIKRVPDARDVIWEKTRAFAAMHGICLNVKGREPKGVVEPGEEYRRTVVEVEQLLYALQGPDGEPVVDATAVADRTYRGPFTREAPDVQFMMRGLSCLPKEDWGRRELFQIRRTAGISGQHRFAGLFALAGPGIARGRILEGMHIQDTTPTLFHAVGEPVPGWMDGQPLADVLAEPREPEIVDEPEPRAVAEGGGDVFSEDEASTIEESLRGLGYLQ